MGKSLWREHLKGLLLDGLYAAEGMDGDAVAEELARIVEAECSRPTVRGPEGEESIPSDVWPTIQENITQIEYIRRALGCEVREAISIFHLVLTYSIDRAQEDE